MLSKAMGAAHSGRNNEAIFYQDSRDANLSNRRIPCEAFGDRQN
jgi:hypothetical protein